MDASDRLFREHVQEQFALPKRYQLFYYERVPFARKWKWEVRAATQTTGERMRHSIHIPVDLNVMCRTEEAAQQLVDVYSKLLLGLTFEEAQALVAATVARKEA